MSVHSVTFSVDNVKPNKLNENKYKESPSVFLRKRLTETEPSFSWKKKALKPSPYIEAVCEGNLGRNAVCNGFLQACTDAYADHHDLELWVDHVKLTILQAFALHVNTNADKLRDKLVNHEGQKNLVVERNEFIKGGNNNWPGVFSEFSDKIKADIKDPELVKKAQRPSETTTDTIMASFNIALMDSFSKFYTYEVRTMCGIPSITLKGSVEDWEALKDLVNYMGQYDFQWYTDKMSGVLDEFIAAAKGKANVDFWKSFVKVQGGSGGPYYSGHLTYLFPYLESYKGPHRQNNFTDDITSSCIPNGISSVPFVWKYYEKTFNMKFISGFFSTTISSNGSLMPDILWAIEDVDKGKTNYDVPEDIAECYRKGQLYEPAGLHYGKPDGGIICDFCQKSAKDKAWGYGKNSDLCMTCYDLVKGIIQ